jgi:hypothetical protein
MNNDITLFYFGASGGFFCLHLLLLTGKYHCKFCKHDQNFDNIFNKQWNISDVSKWKETETWPDNTATLESNLSNKIYYICNHIEDIALYSGKKILLYTDFETQWYLAKTKQVAWFFETTYQDMIKQIHHEFTAYYNTIKAVNWPACNSIYDFNNLPNYIKTECLENWDIDKKFPINATVELDLEKFIKNNLRAMYNGEVTDIDLSQFDIVIKLQDLIKTDGDVLFKQLGIKGNRKCKDFVKLWLSKHTDEQRQYLLRQGIP